MQPRAKTPRIYRRHPLPLLLTSPHSLQSSLRVPLLLQHVLRPGVALTLEVERGGRGFHRMRQLSFERKSAKQLKRLSTKKVVRDTEHDNIQGMMPYLRIDKKSGKK